jgi:hypothetical protein
MKKVILTALTLCLSASAAPAQKGKQTLFGDTWTGITAVDFDKRELRLRAADETKPGTFDGVFDTKVMVWGRDGGSAALGPAELALGERVSVTYKTKDETAGGQKLKVNRITALIFLGPDDFGILRSRLNLSDTTRVTLAESKPLPAASPLKLYAVMDNQLLRQSFVSWLQEWQKKKAEKYGAVELVPELAGADAVLVIHGGTSPATFGLGGAASISFEGEGYRVKAGNVTGFLLTPSGDGFEIVWREQFAISTDSAHYPKGDFHPELEKHLKARLKK